jgi:hypothetical protein
MVKDEPEKWSYYLPEKLALRFSISAFTPSA